MPHFLPTRSRVLAVATAALVTAGLLTALPAHADTSPVTGTPETVSTDPLPTAQIDGIVWTQVVVGDTVYVGGRFSTARPPGAAVGVNTVPRTNIAAYSLSTGQLTGFAPVLNGDVNTLAASPDGSRLYVGGTFTSVNGSTRWRVAAFDTATGALVTNFVPAANGAVNAITATASTVYLGGAFTAIGSQIRNRVAAVAATNGALVATFAPSADNGRVRGIAVSPDATRIVIAGSFTTVNGSSNPGYGMAALSPTGALLPWAVNSRVRNAGENAAIYSLVSDGDSVYGTGYHFGAGGNLEGAFRADWNGNLVWVEDCHGDTYSGAITGGTFYTAGHPHYCGTSGGFPQTDPWTFQRGMAWSKAVSGNVNNNQTLGYASWAGTPAPTLLNWWPDFNTGTVSGATQGPWSIAANENYVVYGGEFTRVNNVPQQGLVRFAVRSLATNKDGPRLSAAGFVPELTSPAPGAVQVSWLANYDRDNQYLTYDVIRDGNTATPAYTGVHGSRIWWDRPTLTFYDTGLSAGTHTYRLRATDPFGNRALGDTVSITVADTGTASAYGGAVLADGAANHWRLGEASGTSLVDSAGSDNAVAAAGVTLGRAGALSGDASTSASFSGTSTGTASTQRLTLAPSTFTLEAWFSTNSNRGGKIVGFGNRTTGNSGVHDRSLYLDNQGRVFFGVYNGAQTTISSAAGFNNNRWHHVVATLGSDGMRLYIDGVQVAQRAGAVTPDNYSGYWRIGGDSSWAGSSGYLAGSLDEVAVYNSVLTPAAIARHHSIGVGTAVANTAPTARFTSTTGGLEITVDGSTSTDSDGSIASYSWNWGDGTPAGSGATASHTYAAGGTYTVTLTATDDEGATGTTSAQVQVAAANAAPTASFTATPSALSVSVDGAASADSDGTLASYAWNWGDGTPDTRGTAATATHTYASAGTYTVTLTVTDDAGAVGTTTRSVTVAATAPANAAPTASFTATASGLTANVDGSGSTDSDGTVASYSWNWGDGSPAGTGATATHSYAAGGTYTITLTVTDDDGATATATRSLAVSAPTGTTLAADTFGRSVTGGFGSADTGGAWTVVGGASSFSVSGGSGSIVTPAGGTRYAVLPNVSTSRADVQTTATVTVPTSGTQYIGLFGRVVGNSAAYLAQARVGQTGAVTLVLIEQTSTTTATTLRTVTVPNLTAATGDQLQIRFQVVGTNGTALNAKVWRTGTTEPTTWHATASGTASVLQTAGGVGVYSFLSGSASPASVTTRFDDLSVTSVP